MSRSEQGTLLQSGGSAHARGQEPEIPPSIQEVKQRHTSHLLEEPGVVSVGLGQDAKGNPAIIVGVDAQRPETQARLPQSLEGYPVITRILGEIEAQ